MFYSPEDGQKEAAHVFIDGNCLLERLKDSENFSIAELGFGTGLNFLETWRQWMNIRRPGQYLIYTTFERYPLAFEEMVRAHKPWPDLAPRAARLQAAWQDGLHAGGQWQCDAQTEIVVIIGEAGPAVSAWPESAQAWFLDGFAPAKNPDMWSGPLMQAVFDKTAPGGSFATFTAAGWVRRNLQKAGFCVAKRKGFAGKREMLVGQKTPLTDFNGESQMIEMP